MNYFLDTGYLNFEKIIKRPMPFQLVIAARGTGKTYAGVKYLLERKTENKFIFMRRTQTQLDMIKDAAMSPFTVVDNTICTQNVNKYVSGVYRGEADDKGIIKPQGAPIGYCMALSTISNIRGFNTADVDIILFDEITGEEHERPIKGERGGIVFNMYETINRNRELDGKPPVKLIMFCNSDRIDAAILDALNISDIVRKMSETGSNMYENERRGLGVYMVGDSPISKRKAETALYKMAENDNFKAMALDNKFIFDGENIKSLPLAEYKPLVSGGGITITRHKDNNAYYIIDNEILNARSADYINKNYKAKMYRAAKKNGIYFQNLKAKNAYLQIFGK